MIDPDHPNPVARLIGLAVAGGASAGVLHGLTDRMLTAFVGAAIATAFAALLELARPALRRHGEHIAQRVRVPDARPSHPPDAP